MSALVTRNLKINILDSRNTKLIRFYATQVGVNLKSVNEDVILNTTTQSIKTLNEPEWDTALPYRKIPGPSRLKLLTSFLPGGRLYKKPLVEIYREFRAEYGDLVLMPGLFKKRDILVLFNPENFRKVFRTEGIWPTRLGLDTITYYRKIIRPDIYEKAGGLAAEQGEDWARFRSVVNPVMMQPKTIKLYVPTIDECVDDFVKKIRKIRNPNNLEVGGNFLDEINNFTLESVGVVGLDTRLGLINSDVLNPKAQKLIQTIKDFFDLVYELDFKPSMWKYIRTPKFTKLIQTLDEMTDITTEYIDEAQRHFGHDENKENNEESVLKKLLKVDKNIARVMAMDMIMAGVDTSGSALVSCLYHLSKNPDKQDILRKEILEILPEKTSKLTSDKMKNMPYLRGCMKESLRLSPVVAGNFRTTGQNLVLDGYQVPKGVDIIMASSILQIDENIFPNANKFLPERWLRKQSTTESENTMESIDQCPSARDADPFIFLPFGFGPRMCIGKRFVELEIECALLRLLRNFHVEYHHGDLKFKSNVINVPDGELRFKFIDVPY